jgi:hypothetical protein
VYDVKEGVFLKMSRKGVKEGRKKIRHWYSYLRNDVLEKATSILFLQISM